MQHNQPPRLNLFRLIMRVIATGGSQFYVILQACVGVKHKSWLVLAPRQLNRIGRPDINLSIKLLSSLKSGQDKENELRLVGVDT